MAEMAAVKSQGTYGPHCGKHKLDSDLFFFIIVTSERTGLQVLCTFVATVPMVRIHGGW